MDKIFNLIGLAMRARKIVSGDELFESIRNQKVHLVILASDAGANTKKKVNDKCAFYNVKILEIEDSKRMNHAIGKKNRMAIGITDEGFSKSILNCWKG